MDKVGNGWLKRVLWSAAIAIAGVFPATVAFACGGVYAVQEGDSLSVIARRFYADAGKWRTLHRDNRAIVGDDPDALRPGLRLTLACIDGLPLAADDPTVATVAPAGPVTPGPQAPDVINLVTAGDFTPFTDRALAQGGLITEMVTAALAQSVRPEDIRINWVNDRNAHLDPLMSEGMMDMAFASYRPDCAVEQARVLCRDFLFSDPMFEVLILLFVDKSRPLAFAQDSDIEGKNLCRPAGFAIDDLDRPDRKWISSANVTLMQPLAVRDCFAMLMTGAVDAVAINEFTGRAAVRDLELQDRIEVIEGRPLSIETLHVLVHKNHPQADALLDLINSGLAQIRASGEFQQVIERHLPQFWASF